MPVTADNAGSIILRTIVIRKNDMANPVTGMYTDVIITARTVRKLLGTTSCVNLRIARNATSRMALAATVT